MWGSSLPRPIGPLQSRWHNTPTRSVQLHITQPYHFQLHQNSPHTWLLGFHSALWAHTQQQHLPAGSKPSQHVYGSITTAEVQLSVGTTVLQSFPAHPCPPNMGPSPLAASYQRPMDPRNPGGTSSLSIRQWNCWQKIKAWSSADPWELTPLHLSESEIHSSLWAVITQTIWSLWHEPVSADIQLSSFRTCISILQIWYYFTHHWQEWHLWEVYHLIQPTNPSRH